jgi:hypothetical protein
MTNVKCEMRVGVELSASRGIVVSVKRAKGRVLALVSWESGMDAGKQSWESVRDLNEVGR